MRQRAKEVKGIFFSKECVLSVTVMKVDTLILSIDFDALGESHILLSI